MVTFGTRKKLAAAALVLVAGITLMTPAALAQGDVHGAEATVEAVSMASALRAVGLALSSALAIGVSAMATAKVQSAVGAGGTGALAEKPDLFGVILVLIAIPETIVIFGFVISILLWLNIG